MCRGTHWESNAAAGSEVELVVSSRPEKFLRNWSAAAATAERCPEQNELLSFVKLNLRNNLLSRFLINPQLLKGEF